MNALAATPQVIDTLKKANKLVNSTNLNTNQSPSKQPLTRIEGNLNGTTNLVPARVVEGSGLYGYVCDIFANGLTEAPTDRGTVFLANGGSSIFSLPPGTVIYVQKMSISVQGGL